MTDTDYVEPTKNIDVGLVVGQVKLGLCIVWIM